MPLLGMSYYLHEQLLRTRSRVERKDAKIGSPRSADCPLLFTNFTVCFVQHTIMQFVRC